MVDFFARNPWKSGAGGLRAKTAVLAALTRPSGLDFRLTLFQGRMQSPIFFARNRAAYHRRGMVSTKIRAGRSDITLKSG